MSFLFAQAEESIVDWGALGEVILICMVVGILIAAVLGVGVVSSLRAQTAKGGQVLALNAVTVISVLLVAAALVAGIYAIAHK